jgi:hypothetical protein
MLFIRSCCCFSFLLKIGIIQCFPKAASTALIVAERINLARSTEVAAVLYTGNQKDWQYD